MRKAPNLAFSFERLSASWISLHSDFPMSLIKDKAIDARSSGRAGIADETMPRFLRSCSRKLLEAEWSVHEYPRHLSRVDLDAKNAS
jgi:hypothetical protein